MLEQETQDILIYILAGVTAFIFIIFSTLSIFLFNSLKHLKQDVKEMKNGVVRETVRNRLRQTRRISVLDKDPNVHTYKKEPSPQPQIDHPKRREMTTEENHDKNVESDVKKFRPPQMALPRQNKAYDYSSDEFQDSKNMPLNSKILPQNRSSQFTNNNNNFQNFQNYAPKKISSPQHEENEPKIGRRDKMREESFKSVQKSVDDSHQLPIRDRFRRPEQKSNERSQNSNDNNRSSVYKIYRNNKESITELEIDDESDSFRNPNFKLGNPPMKRAALGKRNEENSNRQGGRSNFNKSSDVFY